MIRRVHGSDPMVGSAMRVAPTIRSEATRDGIVNNASRASAVMPSSTLAA